MLLPTWQVCPRQTSVKMWRLLRTVHPYEGAGWWGIPINYVYQCLHYCLRHVGWIMFEYHLVNRGDKMIGQPCYNSSEVAFRQHLTISVHSSLHRFPCPLQARELLLGTDCIQDVGNHVYFFLHTFRWLSSPCYLFLQLMSQHVRPITCFSLSS